METLKKILKKKQKMKILKSRRAENVKGDILGFINIHAVAKYQEIEGDPFVLEWFFRGFGCVQNQALW